MESEATPRRKLRIRRTPPAYGTYGFKPRTPAEARKNRAALDRLLPYLHYSYESSPPPTSGTDQPESLTSEESQGVALSFVMRQMSAGATASWQRRSPEVRAEQQRRDRERMEQHRAAMATVAREARARRADVTRGRDRHVRTVSLPRTRSREQSHAPRRAARSTPKAASRSGDSGDSSPPGSSPAAVAALFFLLAFGRKP